MAWKRNTGYYGSITDKQLKTFLQFKKGVIDNIDDTMMRARYQLYVKSWRINHADSRLPDNEDNHPGSA